LPVEQTDAGFKATLALLAWCAETVRPKGLLIDATHFRPPSFGPGMMEWRDATIIPRYGAAGVRGFAFHMPAGFPHPMEEGGAPAVDGPAVFPTARFRERANAIAWLKAAGPQS